MEIKSPLIIDLEGLLGRLIIFVEIKTNLVPVNHPNAS